MEEETLYDRIGEADLNPTYKDGQVYQHTDVNNMLSILKTAVNENYYDIQRMQSGEKTVGNANELDGATLSRYVSETLQADDNKIPSSQQAKAYMDSIFAEYSAPIRGVDYWTEEDQQQIADEIPPIVQDQISEMGPLGFNPTGDYDETRQYHKLDVVYYQGSSYVAKMDTLGNTPTNDGYWYVLAKGGIDVVYDSVVKTLNIAIQGKITYNSIDKNLVFETA